MTEPITGGCQCGAIRYRLNGEVRNPHICHCRMCQKAFGSFFAALVGVKVDDFELTRGAVSIFQSSDQADRGFCSRCGTPLTFQYRGADYLAVSIGSLDHPERIQPEAQMGLESRVPYFATLHDLPGDETTEDADPDMAAKIRASSHQHPDHDTSVWPPRGRGTMA